MVTNKKYGRYNLFAKSHFSEKSNFGKKKSKFPGVTIMRIPAKLSSQIFVVKTSPVKNVFPIRSFLREPNAKFCTFNSNLSRIMFGHVCLVDKISGITGMDMDLVTNIEFVDPFLGSFFVTLHAVTSKNNNFHLKVKK